MPGGGGGLGHKIFRIIESLNFRESENIRHVWSFSFRLLNLYGQTLQLQFGILMYIWESVPME